MAKRTRSLRKIPLFIQTRLESIGNAFQIAVVKRISVSEIMAGSYNHVGLVWEKGQVSTVIPKPPSEETGRSARINLNGQQIVRRDLPKIQKTIQFVNNCLFGHPGWSATITQVRWVLVREQIAPRALQIEARVLASRDEDAIVMFRIVKTYRDDQSESQQELLFGLNLLQESVGNVNVFPPTADRTDFLGSIQVRWEILPAGERESNINLILSGFRPKTEQERDEIERLARERYSFFESLQPEFIVRGTGGMNGYMGALIRGRGLEVVVFEHLTPGNGVYILFGDWEEQSQRTKTDLLQNAEEGKDYIRVTHTGDWQVRVRNVIADYIQ